MSIPPIPGVAYSSPSSVLRTRPAPPVWSNKDRDIGRSAIRSGREVSDSGETGIIQLAEADDHGALGREHAADLAAGNVGINLLRREVDIDDVVGSQDRVEGQRHIGKRAFRRNGPARLSDAVATGSTSKIGQWSNYLTDLPAGTGVDVCRARHHSFRRLAAWRPGPTRRVHPMPPCRQARPLHRRSRSSFRISWIPPSQLDARVPTEGSCLPAVFMPTETQELTWLEQEY